MSKLKELIKEVFPETPEEEMFSDPVKMCYFIVTSAHKGQYRGNGDPYCTHPIEMVEKFCELITPTSKTRISRQTLNLNGIPSVGVREVCLLHDVVEDTNITHEDIKELYYECGFKDRFDEYIDIPLKLITHDKTEPYESYIKKVMRNPIASLVKMLDLDHNLSLFGLYNVTDEDVERSKRYIDYFKMINDKYLFLPKFYNARDMEMNYNPNEEHNKEEEMN